MTKKRIIIYILILIFILSFVFFYFDNKRVYEIDYGVSFNQNYATSLGLDWRTVYTEILRDLSPKYIRISAMWSEIERDKGVYDYDDVDWMMAMAGEYGVEVLLVIGQKAPRWPECHVPSWLDYEDVEFKNYLLTYVRNTVERYRDHRALQMWQVENEPFIGFAFGECAEYHQEFVEDEISLVRSLDPIRKIVLTDSGELSLWRKPVEYGDVFGTTLYRVVRTKGGYIFTYDWLPASFYRYKSFYRGLNYEEFIIAELQAEPWFIDVGAEMTPLEEQLETMNMKRFEKTIEYSGRVGAHRAYLWGVEWWYFMKMRGMDEFWDYGREVLE